MAFRGVDLSGFFRWIFVFFCGCFVLLCVLGWSCWVFRVHVVVFRGCLWVSRGFVGFRVFFVVSSLLFGFCSFFFMGLFVFVGFRAISVGVHEYFLFFRSF